MYEQVSHSLLNKVLVELRPKGENRLKMHGFYTRLGANFYSIYSLFQTLYGTRDDFEKQIQRLVEVMAKQYVRRPQNLKTLDLERERDHNWFLSQKWVAMALYCDGFAGDLAGLKEKLSYLGELGVNMIHVMSILDCPPDKSDGGYAVRDFRNLDSRVGTLDQFTALAKAMREREMLLTVDVVLNHTSDEHEWAQRARNGEQKYEDYYYVFSDRTMPNMFEETMADIFPETSPGNFTWNEEMDKWVMTSFNSFQWDLNFSNPAVFIEMLDIVLFWANLGADIVRLDAVAFLWKKIGSTSQNEREAHLILQLLKDCCQVTAPGVLFIAEAIVAPKELTKYFGEDAVIAKECEIAYNATLMALLWEAIATKETTLLKRGLRSLPGKLDRATWLNYVRCHDDIGLGMDDEDIRRVGFEPSAHRRFLVDYYTGKYDTSPARGQTFAENPKTGDARIAGSLASLIGLETAIESGDENSIEAAIDLILLLHSVILSFGGIPLLYYGDEIGVLNNYSYREDEIKRDDSRWIHRPTIDWDKAEQANRPGSIESRIFNGLKKMIAVRKEVPAFADFNNRELLNVNNEHLLAFTHFDNQLPSSKVVVVVNFDDDPQRLDLEILRRAGISQPGAIRDLCTGKNAPVSNGDLIIPRFGFLWLQE